MVCFQFGIVDNSASKQGKHYTTKSERNLMKRYMCVVCGFIYDEELGLPEEGIPPGTRWDDIPENWSCPECGATKSDFEMIAV